MTVERRPLRDEVKRRIVGAILDGGRKPGEKIGSIRSFASRLGVSHMTAVKAVRELEAEGFLECRPGSGTYITAKTPTAFTEGRRNRLKSLYFFSYKAGLGIDSYHADLLYALHEEAERRNWNLRLCRLENTVEFQQACADPDAVGVVYPALPPQASPVPKASGTAFRVAYGINPAENSCSVAVDNFAAGRIAGEYLWNRGHREIFFAEPPQTQRNRNRLRHFSERKYALFDYYSEQGCFDCVALPWALHDGKTEELSALLRERLNSKKHLTVVAGNAAMAYEIRMTALTLGLRLPEEMSLLTFIRRNALEREAPITAIDFSHREMADFIVALLTAPAQFQRKNIYLLPMKLTEGNSVANLDAPESCATRASSLF